MPQPWRGADVMNGLLKLDITFEGPEHGGIGSTEYSIVAVNQICRELGLPAERTPFVQVLMVLKELLAQRKLNEPYSGGISSYALLLLLLGLVRERAIIREEIERTERQRQAVASGSTYASEQNGTRSPDVPQVLARPSISQNPSASSSWASIAKTTQTSKAPGSANSSFVEAAKPSFADTVTRSADSSQAESLSKERSRKETKKSETPTKADSNLSGDGVTAVFPESFSDVIEVLCSGETTAGKLLLHFLLYYGQHFDAQTTALDLSGKHERTGPYYSPYIQRKAPGSIDPITGMLTVDPIVIYDPLEGAENNNVARRCFTWTTIRGIFAQSYATLSSAVERSECPPEQAPRDPSLLSCLLSF